MGYSGIGGPRSHKRLWGGCLCDSYTANNSPFEDLPRQYVSVPRPNHQPPRLSFGLAIPHEFDAFAQVALKEKLEKQEALVNLRHFRPLCALGLDYLNDLCGLLFPPTFRGFVQRQILFRESEVSDHSGVCPPAPGTFGTSCFRYSSPSCLLIHPDTSHTRKRRRRSRSI